METSSIVKKFMSISIILLFVISALAVIPAGATDSRAEENVPNMVIIGSVFEANSDKPVVNAKVVLESDTNRFEARTGEHGNFIFEVPHSGYIILITAEGYHPLKEELVKNEHREIVLEFFMKPVEPKHEPMFVFGHVFNEVNKEPIAGALIEFVNDRGHFKAETGEKGGFEIALPPGGYEVKVHKKGFHTAELEIKGESNDKVEMSITLKPAENDKERHWVHVSGKVFVAGTDRPVAGAWLGFKSEHNGYEAKTNEEGFFEAEVIAGFYHVMAGAEGFHEFSTEVDLMNVERHFMEIPLKLIRDERPDEDPDERPKDNPNERPDQEREGERHRPRVFGQVFDAKSNKPMMAEVTLVPECIKPKMNVMLLGIRFGQLEGNEDMEHLAKWDGFIQVTKGVVVPVKTVLFDTGGTYEQGTDDKLYPQANHLTVEWRASTIPHWDGLIVAIAVPVKAEPAPMVTIHTAKWDLIKSFRELVNVHRVITVDDHGNQVEIMTKLIDLPDPIPCPPPERPDRPEHPPRPGNDNPDMPPRDGPQNHMTDSNMPPGERETDRETRAGEDEVPLRDREHEEEPEEFNLEINRERLKNICEKIHKLSVKKMDKKFTTKTNERGFYSFPRLPSGHYQMWVHAPNHMEYYNEFTIRDSQHLKIDVYLRHAKKMDKPKEPLKGKEEFKPKQSDKLTSAGPERTALNKRPLQNEKDETVDAQGVSGQLLDENNTPTPLLAGIIGLIILGILLPILLLVRRKANKKNPKELNSKLENSSGTGKSRGQLQASMTCPPRFKHMKGPVKRRVAPVPKRK
jgi:hypothetical protein